jgi:hypothetical protein
MLQRDPADPRGVSATGHMAMGGGGMDYNNFLLALGLDTRVDVASGGSRWAAGASGLGGVRLGPVFVDGRLGIWRAITSSTSEGWAPSFELGGYIPTSERFDDKHPEHGEDNRGIVFGIREDLDVVNYFTIFVGYAVFIAPGI